MNSTFTELLSVAIDVPLVSFWKAIEVFLVNPRITSKNVAAIVLNGCFPVLVFNNTPNLQDLQCLTDLTDPSAVHGHLQSLIGFQKEVSVEELRESFNHPESDKTFVWIVKILYKNTKYRSFNHKCYIIDFKSSSLTVLPLRSIEDQSRPLPYQINYSANQLVIATKNSVKISPEDKTIDWLRNGVFPRIQKWMQQELSSSTEKSLRLLNCEDYTSLYNSLKLKYGHQMIEIWPERTDPAKFVYEDVAIASYLLMIWKQERQQMETTELQSFVDLGCGNGLLVYILTMEGHRGFGIDLRKRNIWDMYPKEVDLRVETIIPSDENLYPHTDWIIGNHSDELSPWVPVIAARSSLKCRYFLLPCCAFEFNGRKFQRSNSNVSQYEAFLEYAKEISDACGYATEMDRLKIPSTKRICLIGYDRRGRVKDFQKISSAITQLINRACSNSRAAGGNTWSAEFTPRDSVEAVKNCTKIKKSVVAEIVDLVFREIIGEECWDPEIFNGKWNVGRCVQLTELAAKLPKDRLVELKSECGGLQTLLRNHHQIFEVRGGEVKLRIPVSIEEKRRQLEAQQGKQKNKGKFSGSKEWQFQQKPCFFLANHPNGCPLEKAACTFKH